jgi:hypothetical protein
MSQRTRHARSKPCNQKQQLPGSSAPCLAPAVTQRRRVLLLSSPAAVVAVLPDVGRAVSGELLLWRQEADLWRRRAGQAVQVRDPPFPGFPAAKQLTASLLHMAPMH